MAEDFGAGGSYGFSNKSNTNNNTNTGDRNVSSTGSARGDTPSTGHPQGSSLGGTNTNTNRNTGTNTNTSSGGGDPNRSVGTNVNTGGGGVNVNRNVGPGTGGVNTGVGVGAGTGAPSYTGAVGITPANALNSNNVGNRGVVGGPAFAGPSSGPNVNTNIPGAGLGGPLGNRVAGAGVNLNVPTDARSTPTGVDAAVVAADLYKSAATTANNAARAVMAAKARQYDTMATSNAIRATGAVADAAAQAPGLGGAVARGLAQGTGQAIANAYDPRNLPVDVSPSAAPMVNAGLTGLVRGLATGVGAGAAPAVTAPTAAPGWGAAPATALSPAAVTTPMPGLRHVGGAGSTEANFRQDPLSLNTVARHVGGAGSEPGTFAGGAAGMYTKTSLADVVDKIIGAESSGKAAAKNPLSSATGLGQFIDSTWMGLINKYRPDLAKAYGKDEKGLLDLRKDPVLARDMLANLTQDNIAKLNKAGVAITPASIYAAHFLGDVGAVKAYKADPGALAATVLGPAAARANPTIIGNGHTIGHVLDYIDSHMEGVTIGGVPANPAKPTVDTTGGAAGGAAVKTAPGPKEKAPYKRSGLGDAITTGVDIAAPFLIPGLQIPEVASYLLTGQGLAGNLYDLAGGRWGDNQYQPGSGRERAGGGGTGGGPSTTTTTPAKPPSPPPPPPPPKPPKHPDDFASTYLNGKSTAQPDVTGKYEKVPSPNFDWIPFLHTNIRPYSWERT